MKYRFRTLFAALALLASTPAFAQQQMACGDRNDLLAHLKDKFKESAAGAGMTGNGAVMELMTSDSGSWTLILTFPTGRSCLVATGDGWEQWQKKMAGKDA
jgi:hypothetical protein